MALSQGVWRLETRERTQAPEMNMLQLRCPPMALLRPLQRARLGKSRSQLHDKPRQSSTDCTLNFDTGVTDDRHIACVVPFHGPGHWHTHAWFDGPAPAMRST